MKTTEVKERIEVLKARRNAVILAHNYQRPEVQEIADFVGDSLELSRRAVERMLTLAGYGSIEREPSPLLAPEAREAPPAALHQGGNPTR